MFGYRPITEIVTTFTKIFKKLGDVVKMAQNSTKQGERINPLTFLDPRTCAQSRQARSARKLRLSQTRAAVSNRQIL